MEWSIQEVARFTGTTSRTLRHYDAIGLLTPSRVGGGGMRFYDRDRLVDLQRILLLRQLGLGLTAIGEVMARQGDVAAALTGHIEGLELERDRIDRQLASVRRTLTHITQNGEMTMESILDGFDQGQHEQEVRRRWGDDAWESGDRWWSRKAPHEQQAFVQRSEEVNGALRRAAEAGLDPAGAEFQQAVAAHHAWLGEQPHPLTDRERYLSLADMYVADDRFAATYGGPECVARVREAIGIWAERNL